MKKYGNIVCFDLFHTLIVPKKHLVTYEDVFVRLGVQKELIYPFVRDRFMVRPYSIEEMVEMLFVRFNLSIQHNQDAYREAVMAWKSSNECAWIGGAEELLALLRTDTETAVCLISNVTKPGWEGVDQKLGVSRRFDEKFLSWKEGCVKPDFRCWTQLLDRLDASQIKSSHCFMIGDNQRDDLDPPLRMGWNTHLVVEDGRNLKEVYEQINRQISHPSF